MDMQSGVQAASLAERMTALAAPTDKVTILGNGEIDLLLALAKKGFAEVSCRGSARGPHIASDAADIVVAPAIKSEAELALAAAEARRVLKRDGMFLARLADRSYAALGAVGEILGRYGFAAVPESGDLLRCRKLSGQPS